MKTTRRRNASWLLRTRKNTHTPAALYERFEPEEARRIANKIEWHYTPEHGSWLNIAEIELSVLSRQCLSRRVADAGTLEHNAAVWERERNSAHPYHKLAVHNRRRTNQAQKAISRNKTGIGYMSTSALLHIPSGATLAAPKWVMSETAM